MKYEEVDLKAYQDSTDTRRSLYSYFHFYNTERTHQSLSYRTPAEAYYSMEPINGGVVQSPSSTRAGFHLTLAPNLS